MSQQFESFLIRARALVECTALSPDSFRRDSFVGFAAREGAVGIYAADATRNRGDISGESLPFQFTIEDNTKGQVLWFQGTRGLKQDGIVGPATWAALLGV